jgi:GNAT superfamily N-acetyltransferase
MSNLTIEVVQDGNIECCRDLCNELMAFQKSKATIAPEAFDLMNFDTRMKRSFENASASQVIVVKDDGVPVGYVFSTVDRIDESKTGYPAWAPKGEGYLGFYPDWVRLPSRIGCLNNLYVREEYRHLKLGSKLFDQSIEWLESVPDLDAIFIFISNGNDAALNFYLNRGFTYSHEVFGGFIKAVYKVMKK